jgi:outer membrane protein assembly factor BamB
MIGGPQRYALGGSSDLTCLDVRTGKTIWSLNVLQKFGGSNIQWGLSESRLVLHGRLLVNAGGRGASLIALALVSRL